MEDQGLSHEEARVILKSLSQLRDQGVPREKIEMVKDMLIQRDPKLVEWVRQATRHKRRMAEHLLELVTRMGSPSTTGDPVDPFDVSILRKQFGLDEDQAKRALAHCGNDFVAAILYLDAKESSP
ncbi:hypothetical protein AC1031_015357 [Aphanomyces cochlioides]|nr:hypothetical protein AC1031_015357 [Aphanomyces cochlioides]